ncbi:MAG TPA: hypothetical protein VGC27_07970 [Rhizomicrobium sp.]
MRIVELDAGGFKTPLDFLAAVRRAIGAPQEPGLNIDTLVGAMLRGCSAGPCVLRIVGMGKAPSPVREEAEALVKALKDASLWRHNHRYEDIGVAIEIVP